MATKPVSVIARFNPLVFGDSADDVETKGQRINRLKNDKRIARLLHDKIINSKPVALALLKLKDANLKASRVPYCDEALAKTLGLDKKTKAAKKASAAYEAAYEKQAAKLVSKETLAHMVGGIKYSQYLDRSYKWLIDTLRFADKNNLDDLSLIIESTSLALV